ncbi:ribonuclease III [Candidatus Epulonipiscium viviparus]|uniref:ribonuclease III n=1 Tax=Candidatus Epulonipiscium viviparus TaxID=420336 RepID=UPI00016BFC87|nr:ribonuclease III [Candidatus Epulopiscium viviparus]
MSLSNDRRVVLESFEKKIEYTFKRIELLDLALTHSSYANEHREQGVKDNERLEFLGDAILDLIVSEYLFKKYPESQEGDLSKFRASIVCEASLAKAGKRLELGKYILLGHGEEMGGGRDRESIIADAFEAVTGAMLIDSSYEDVKTYLAKTLIEFIKHTSATKLYKDYKTILQIESQKNVNTVIAYEVVEEKGPDHEKEFVVELKQNGKVIGKGSGRTKRDAEQVAAHQALTHVYHYQN